MKKRRRNICVKCTFRTGKEDEKGTEQMHCGWSYHNVVCFVAPQGRRK